MKFDAVIFDLDGTLIDSVMLYEKAYLEACELVGDVVIPKEIFMEKIYCRGVSLEEALQLFGVNLTEESAIRKARDERYIALLASEVNWLPGADNVLSTTNSMVSTGIVTGSWRAYTDAINKRLPIYNMTRCVVTEDDTNGKRKPDPYSLFLAAEQLNVAPERCIYVGDQWFDVEAANAAGMTSCLIPNEITPTDTKNTADVIVANIREVLTLL